MPGAEDSRLFDLLREPLLPGVTLIEASAGTGKTYTVARIYLRLILEGLSPREILVCTFTIPATGELRDRIRSVLRDALVAFRASSPVEDDFLRELVEQQSAERIQCVAYLEQALRSFDEAVICTIHSFCQRTLRENAFETRQLFTSELEGDESELRRELSEDWWRCTFYAAPPLMAALAAAAGLSPGTLSELLGNVMKRPLAVLLPKLEPGGIKKAQAEVLAAYETLRISWAGWRHEVYAIFADLAWTLGKYSDELNRENALAFVDQALNEVAPPIEEVRKLLFFTQTKVDAGTRHNAMRRVHPFFAACEDFETKLGAADMAWRMDFIAWSRGEGERRKVARNVLSYDDLLLRLHEPLHGAGGDAFAVRLRARYRAGLIDEFQDTDVVQNGIFERIFGGEDQRLFLIGDPKQAIYAFRGADVWTYLDAAGRATRRFHLGTNFRSEQPLVKAVNTVFGRHEEVFLNEAIPFRPVMARGMEEDARYVDPQGSAPLSFWFWKTGEAIRVGKAEEQIPRVVAAQVARLLASDAQIGDRKLGPGDIAVLVFKNKDASRVRDALWEKGVPAVTFASVPVFETQEARDLLKVLSAVAQPARDAILRAALATDLMGYRALSLQALGFDERGWEAIVMRFQDYHEVWRKDGFIPMFRWLVRRERLRSTLLSLPLGERRLTNLLHLGELLHSAAHGERHGMGATLRWLSRQIARKHIGDEELELRLESDARAVRVMTTHKSKGLEFNIVFCPYLWRKADLFRDELVCAHDVQNEGALTVDLGSPRRDDLRTYAGYERLSEHVRLLYVALTRARHRCIMLWGRFNTHARSAAMWVLHPPNQPTTELPGALALCEKFTDYRLQRDLDTLVSESEGTIGIVPLPSVDAPRYSPPAPGALADGARPFLGRITQKWRISSFSSLTATGGAEDPDRDVTLRARESAPAEGIHLFPPGAVPGSCLHEIFEELDFVTPGDVHALCLAKLAAYGLEATWADELTALVERILDSELAPGFRLRGIPKRERRSEVEFTLPVAEFGGADLAERLGAEITGDLRFDRNRGVLRGFIDLLVRVDGRFYVLDWKSNWLGSNAAAYTPEVIRDEMHAHRYRFQLHLYTLAIRRYLRGRMPDFSYERDFAGACYVFLRGVTAEVPGSGIYFEKPTVETLDALDALFLGES